MYLVTREAIGFWAGYHHVELNALVLKVHYRKINVILLVASKIKILLLHCTAVHIISCNNKHWAKKVRTVLYHTSISQWNGRSPVWDLRCNFNLDALVNRFSHPSTGHAWGFSLLWVRMWDVKVPGAENTLPHPSISHLYAFRSAWCLLSCTFNLCAVGKVLPQPSYLQMWVSAR